MMLRVLMMTACLFAIASAAQAQSFSTAAVRLLQTGDTPNQTYRPYRVQIGTGLRIELPVLPTSQELAQLEAQAEQLANQPILPAWLTDAVQNGMANLQKLSASSGRATLTSGKPCCDLVQPGIVKGSGIAASDQCFNDVLIKVQETRTGNLMLPTQACPANTVIRHLVNQVPCCGIKDFMQYTCPVQLKVLQATPPCCCAKACACCETCKAKPAAQVCPLPTPMSAPTMVWRAPVPAQAVTRATAVHSPLPRFETPDLEVHCEKMTHRGDMVIFEGSVMLLSKKHAQPIRVNAQRVMLNLKDGSYSVESAGRMAIPVSSFGVLRTSAPESMPPTCPTESAAGVVIAVPGLPMSSPQVIPVPNLWQRCP
jgi:hypothetical protein